MNPLILFVTEHKKELQPYLDLFHPEKNGREYLHSKSDYRILFFSNNGKGGLDLLHTLYRLKDKWQPSIVVNGGLAGSLAEHDSPGTVFTVEGGLMADIAAEKVEHPYIDAGLKGLSSRRLITLPYLQPGCHKKALVWGSLVDLEGYYLLSWAKFNRVPVLLYKMVSDRNESREKISYPDMNPLAEVFKKDLEYLAPVIQDPVSLEALLSLSLPLEKSFEAVSVGRECRENNLTFTRRHQWYQSLKMVNEKKCRETPEEKRAFLFMEKGLSRESDYRRYFSGRTVFNITHYLDYFQVPDNPNVSALFIAHKKGELIREKGEMYGRPGWSHYSAINGYNCPMDCAYCFLKGYFKNHSPVLFTNRDELLEAMARESHKQKKPLLFHFGDYCDGGVYDVLTENISWFSQGIAPYSSVFCEFRTKAVGLGHLAKAPAHGRLSIGFSLAPQRAIDTWEKKTPPLEERLKQARRLHKNGFPISFHLDPLILQNESDLVSYEELARILRDEWAMRGVFSISMGTLRMKRDSFRYIRDNGYAAVLQGLISDQGFYRYDEVLRQEAYNRVGRVLKEGFGDHFYVCMD